MPHDIEVTPFRDEFLPSAAHLWVERYRAQRALTPDLPEILLDENLVAEKIAGLAKASTLFAALQDGRLAGYLGAYLVRDFRHSGNRGSYSPAWGHAVRAGSTAEVYRALYRPAAAYWFENGCRLHCLTLLAGDQAARDVWFWNGFGLWVVDALRSIQPTGVQPAAGVSVRQARVEDAGLVAELEAEHYRHYGQPPVLMVPSAPADEFEYSEFLAQPENSAWLAFATGEALGYLRFESGTFGATDIVQSPQTIVNSGAFLRPQGRGLRAAPAMLDAALRHYAALGYQRCSVDFESFNPEAATFWTKYFQPVCLSVVRRPEIEPPAGMG